MSLFVYIHSKRNNFDPSLKEKLSNHCHIEYSLFDEVVIDQPGIYEALFTFSKDTAFYKDNDHQVKKMDSREFLALQGYCWNRYGGEETRSISANELLPLIKNGSSNFRSVQSQLSGEYSVIYRSSKGKIVSFNDNFGIENIFYYEDDDLCVISNREDFVKISSNINEYNYSTLCQFPLVGYRLLDEGVNKNIKKLTPGGG